VDYAHRWRDQSEYAIASARPVAFAGNLGSALGSDRATLIAGDSGDRHESPLRQKRLFRYGRSPLPQPRGRMKCYPRGSCQRRSEKGSTCDDALSHGSSYRWLRWPSPSATSTGRRSRSPYLQSSARSRFPMPTLRYCRRRFWPRMLCFMPAEVSSSM